MSLLQRLHKLQEQHGYLNEATLRELSRAEHVLLYRLQGLVSFYPHFHTRPPPRHELAICRDASCWLADGAERCQRLRQQAIGIPDLEIREVSCLGRCDMAPAAALNDVPIALAEVDQVSELLSVSLGATGWPPISGSVEAWDRRAANPVNVAGTGATHTSRVSRRPCPSSQRRS